MNPAPIHPNKKHRGWMNPAPTLTRRVVTGTKQFTRK